MHLHNLRSCSVRVTVDGNCLEYSGDTTTHCASQTTTKCLLNSVISTPAARFMTIDIKYFYYNTPMEVFEYMALPFSLMPEDIVKQYNSTNLVHKSMIYVEI